MTNPEEQNTPSENSREVQESISWIQQELESKPDGPLQALLLLEKAEAFESVGNVRDALKEMVNAVNSDSTLLPAIWMLIRILIKYKSWKNLVRLRQAEQKAAKTPSEKACALFSWGAFQEDHTHDLEKAAKAFSKAVEVMPEDHASLLALERVGLLTGDLGMVAESLRKQVQLPQDERRKALLLIDLARLQHSLGDGSEDQAIDLLREAATVERGQWHWLKALEKHAERVGRQLVVAEALEGRAQIMSAMTDVETASDAIRFGAPWVDNPAEAAARAATLRRRAAKLQRKENPDAAIENLRRSLELVPDDELVSYELFQLLDQQEQGDAAKEQGLLRIEALGDDPDALLWRSRVAELMASRGETEEAIAHYRRVLEAVPSSLVAFSGAEKLFSSRSNWEDLAALYEQTASSVEDKDPEFAQMLLIRAAEVVEGHLEDPERALSTLNRAGALVEGNVTAERLSASILLRLERFPEAVQVLERLVEHATNAQCATVLLDEIASIQRAQLQDGAGAIDTYRRILVADAQATWVLEILAELHAEQGRWTELAAIHDQKAELETTDERAAAQLAVAGWVLQCHGGAPEAAEARYRKALERYPDSALAAAGLEELAWQQGESKSLRKLLRQRAERTVKAPEVERLLLTVALDCEGSAEIEEAVGVYQELLERVGSSRAARWGLARCYRKLGRWQEYGDILDSEVEHLEDDQDQGAILLELAELTIERLAQVSAGEDVLRRALDASPELLPAVLAMSDCVRLDSSWSEVDAYLQKFLDLAPEAALMVAEERLSLFAGPAKETESAQVMAGVLLENVPDHGLALVWRALLGGEGGDAAEKARSWNRLGEQLAPSEVGGQLLAHARNSAALIGDGGGLPVTLADGDIALPLAFSLTEYGDISGDDAVRALTARRQFSRSDENGVLWDLELAQALEEQGKFGEAQELYRGALEGAPGSIGALEGLVRTTEKNEHWPANVKLTEALASLYRSPKVAASRWAAASATWMERLDDPERAELACRNALSLDPENIEAFVRLLSLLRGKNDWQGLSELIENRIGCVDAPEELVHLLLAQSDLLRKLGQNDESQSSLETALLVDQENPAALKARAVNDVEDSRWSSALTSLREFADSAEIQEDERRLALWRVAEVLVQRHGDPLGALEPLGQLVENSDGDPDTYRRLVQVARWAKEWSVAAAALASLAEGSPDAQERIDASRSEGIIRRSLMNDPAGAVTAWERVAHALPFDVQAIEALVTLADESRRPAVIAGIQARVQKLVGDDPLDSAGLRALLSIHKLAGSPDGALCVLRVLDALGVIGADEQEELDVLLTQAPTEPQRPLGRESLSLITHPGQSGVAEGLHQLLAPILHKVFAADVTAMRLSRPMKQQGDLLLERVQGAAEVFGLGNVAVRKSSESSISLVAVQATEPTIGVGAQKSGHLSTADRCLLGRALWHARCQTGFLANRTEIQIRAYFDAATKEGYPSFQPTERRLGVEALQKGIHKYLPRKSRRPMAEIATSLARADEASIVGWARAVKAGSDRAGLLLCGDPAVSLAQLVPGWRGESKELRQRSAERVRTSQEALELLGFATSNEYLALRREVGLATQSW